LGAASTTEILQQLSERFTEQEGIAVLGDYGSSSMLARQIEAGAPWDLFLSADPQWVDVLAGKRLLEPDTRHALMGNHLVLVAPRGKLFSVQFERAFNFAGAFTGRLAIGDPASVPAGKYAQQALEHLNWWDAVENRLMPGADVRQTLRMVEMGEVDAGIV